MKSPQDVKKLSVLLSSDLHLRAKRHALQNDKTLTELITTLLSDFLDAAEKRNHKPKP